MLIQPLRLVLHHARGDDFGFPCARGSLESLELSEHRRQRVGALHARLRQHALPFAQESEEIARLYRLDLGAQTLDGVAMYAREQSALAPLFLRAP